MKIKRSDRQDPDITMSISIAEIMDVINRNERENSSVPFFCMSYMNGFNKTNWSKFGPPQIVISTMSVMVETLRNLQFDGQRTVSLNYWFKGPVVQIFLDFSQENYLMLEGEMLRGNMVYTLELFGDVERIIIASDLNGAVSTAIHWITSIDDEKCSKKNPLELMN